ncbi:hypothetical protein D0X99_00540 [Algoriphagus lacus]|uniref:Seryl-tRNA synthetase n=1 Tax=Algoriphagus lacus TaxID=2056311 RepID=A0A418PVZ2_9BACT|nr:hypothetical protein [Algoriphagus lacus]RIW18222.1 hypothetical protein D0X99_00540 [Algoriphagus lacus]
MKKLLILLVFVFSMQGLTAAPDSNPKTKNPELTEAQKIRAKEMESRLEEIKAMDFKSMSKDEIRNVKVEMKEMKAEARASGNGVYLSIGAVIIIILLLILLV